MPVPWQALLVIALLAVGFTGGSAYHLIRERRLFRIGVRTQAVVVDLRTVSDRRNRPQVSPIVEFVTGDGRTVRAKSPVSSSTPTVMPGRGLTVYYDPENPEQVAIQGYGQGVYRSFLVIGILLFGLLAALLFGPPEMWAPLFPAAIPIMLGCVFFGIGAYGVGRVWLLRAKGGEADGVVVAESTNQTREGMPLHHPVVRFRLPTGQEIQTTSERGRTIRRLHAGQSVRVCYDPDDPYRVVLAGDGARPVFYVFAVIGLMLLIGTAYVGLTLLGR